MIFRIVFAVVIGSEMNMKLPFRKKKVDEPKVEPQKAEMSLNEIARKYNFLLLTHAEFRTEQLNLALKLDEKRDSRSYIR